MHTYEYLMSGRLDSLQFNHITNAEYEATKTGVFGMQCLYVLLNIAGYHQNSLFWLPQNSN